MNLKQSFRPLVGGIGIIPYTTRRWATLGLIAEGHGRRWLLTASHALGTLSHGSRLIIGQGEWNTPESAICDVDASDVQRDSALDVAAVPLLPTINSVPEVVGLGRTGTVGDAVDDMMVVRVGVATGLVRGVVTSATLQRVEIASPSHYPPSYSLGEPGDSGAVWLSFPDLDLIGLHIARSHAGIAIASPLKAVLESWGLAPLR